MINHILSIQAKTYLPAIAIGLLHLSLPLNLLDKIFVDGLILAFFTIVLACSYKKDVNIKNCSLLNEPGIDSSLILVLAVNLIGLVILSIPTTLIVSIGISEFHRDLVDTFIGVLASFSWVLILIVYGFLTTKYCINDDGIYLMSGIWHLDIKYSQISGIRHEPQRIALFPYPILSEKIITGVFLGNRLKDFVCVETNPKVSPHLFYSKIYITPAQVKTFLDLVQEKYNCSGAKAPLE